MKLSYELAMEAYAAYRTAFRENDSSRPKDWKDLSKSEMQAYVCVAAWAVDYTNDQHKATQLSALSLENEVCVTSAPRPPRPAS